MDIDLDADTDPYAPPLMDAAKAARMDMAFAKLGRAEKELLLDELAEP